MIEEQLIHQHYVDLLVDIRQVASHKMAARRAGAEYMARLPYRRIAMFGSRQPQKTLIRLMIKGAGVDDRVQLFDSQEEAQEWLSEVI